MFSKILVKNLAKIHQEEEFTELEQVLKGGNVIKDTGHSIC